VDIKQPGGAVTVAVEPDDAEHTVEVPRDLAAAPAHAGVRVGFDALSYSKPRELATAIAVSERPETRSNRIDKVVAAPSWVLTRCRCSLGWADSAMSILNVGGGVVNPARNR
jgi:hypothetical protein